MTDFQFLLSEFKPLHEPAKGAEQLVCSDARGCCTHVHCARTSRNRIA
jgi:type I restriction enzyme R subunit